MSVLPTDVTTTLLASIPSPSQGVWYLGPFPLRAYALAIIVGIVVAVWLTNRRWVERGGDPDEVLSIVYWAVPFGIVGGRFYHVVSSPDAYFGTDGDLVSALYIWQGGLGIWGAIALGAVGAYIGCRREKVRFASFADAVAPGLFVAQAIGRLGNWFNQELFGSPTTLPWGLEIDPAIASRVVDYVPGMLFHPTFLYELLWNLAGAAVLVAVDRRRRLGHGRVLWLYVAIYTLGRVWIEMLRIDDAERVLGLRLNVWTSIVLFVVAVVAFVVLARRGGREATVYVDPQDPRRLGTEPQQDTHDERVEDGVPSSENTVAASEVGDTPSGAAGEAIADDADTLSVDVDEAQADGAPVEPGSGPSGVTTPEHRSVRSAAEAAHDTSSRRAQREDNAGADTGLP